MDVPSIFAEQSLTSNMLRCRQNCQQTCRQQRWPAVCRARWHRERFIFGHLQRSSLFALFWNARCLVSWKNGGFPKFVVSLSRWVLAVLADHLFLWYFIQLFPIISQPNRGFNSKTWYVQVFHHLLHHDRGECCSRCWILTKTELIDGASVVHWINYSPPKSLSAPSVLLLWSKSRTSLFLTGWDSEPATPSGKFAKVPLSAEKNGFTSFDIISWRCFCCSFVDTTPREDIGEEPSLASKRCCCIYVSLILITS